MGFAWHILHLCCNYILCSSELVLPSSRRKPQINAEVKKDNPKVVDLLEIEDFAQEKASYCRCWRSTTVMLWPCYITHVCCLLINYTSISNVMPCVVRSSISNVMPCVVRSSI